MKKLCRKIGICGILLGVLLLAAGFAFRSSTVDVQAATNGFRTVNGKTYYYKDGKKVKGWITVSGKKYFANTNTGALLKGWRTTGGAKRYFDKSTGAMYTGFQQVSGKYYYFDTDTGKTKTGFIKCEDGKTRYFQSDFTMATGWMKNSSDQRWYFDTSTGAMYVGKKKIGNYYYYFDKSTGAAQKGFITASNGNTRYFRSKSYRMATGWITNSKGQKRYFHKTNGIMYKGLKRVSGKYYYFDSSTGIAASGWVTTSDGKRYFDTSTFVMVTGTKTIDGVTYVFSTSTGLLQSSSDDDPQANDIKPTTPTSERTIKNYLAGALQPVGQALYVWGGGWNDSTRKGVSPTWKTFYNSQSSDYNYKSDGLNDLSTTNRAKGLDCSGFVGWAAYQVMHKTSGEGSGYTVVSGDIGSYYTSLGWGTAKSWSSYNFKMKPGDVGYDSGHTWIVLGQCSDQSIVIVHSTPQAGCQIAGTPTPDGDYDSEAVALAKKYMSKYSGYSKYDYHTSAGNYLRRGNYFRWNTSTLSDPDGYKNMTAAQILADLFS